MKPLWKRLSVYSVVLAVAALIALVLWALSADARGRWLHEAAWNNDTDTAKLLVRLGTGVNFKSGNGTALHGAAHTGNIELMSFLIEHGANVDAVAKFGITPLWNAGDNKQLAAEQLLLAHGANPDTSQINPP